METQNPIPLNLFERFNRWLQDSIMIKLFSIGILVLILLIPSAWIEQLIYERQSRADEGIEEVADKWSGEQKLSGPVLVVPYNKLEVIDLGKDGKEFSNTVEKAFFLPENLTVNGHVKPEVLHRGIFDAVVYQSAVTVNATFAKPDFKAMNIDEANVNWRDAYLVFGITDLRGIADNPVITSGDQMLSAEPSHHIGVSVRRTNAHAYADYSNDQPALSSTGIISKLAWGNAESFAPNVTFKLNLKGSRKLDFVPAGKTTNVKVTGDWNNPSFDGEFLPSDREITESTFSAAWKVLHFNRPFAQSWTESNQELSGADFGVRLLIPVDQYQKSIRTSKYSILIILLSFMALFLVELTQKIRIHPFQYILIGAALTIYYTLLLSVSEHLGYNLAYVIASVATVILITLYSRTFFASGRLTALLAILLTVFYGFVYVIILQQDFSLLIGSIGLFLVVGAIMYFSRKVRWYSERTVQS